MNPDFLYSELGKFVKRYRLVVGMNQSDLATRCKLNRATIAAIELGRQSVTLHQIFQIAAALDVRPIDLIPRHEQAEMDKFMSQIEAGTASSDLEVLSRIAQEVINGQRDVTVKAEQVTPNRSAV